MQDGLLCEIEHLRRAAWISHRLNVMTDHSGPTSDREYGKVYGIRSLVGFRPPDPTHNGMAKRTRRRVLIGRNDKSDVKYGWISDYSTVKCTCSDVGSE
jgi:hypothetical protein